MSDEELLKEAENWYHIAKENEFKPSYAYDLQRSTSASLLLIARNSSKQYTTGIDFAMPGGDRTVAVTPGSDRDYDEQYHIVETERSDAHVMHFDCDNINDCVIMNDLNRLLQANELPEPGEYTAHVDQETRQVIYEAAAMENLA